MDLETYRARYSDDDEAAPGWDAISAALEALYAGQKPLHWAPELPAVLGGPDPLNGVSAYVSHAGGMAHLHFCTYGYSQLYYDEAAIGKDFSRYGFEMTFRLASPLPPPKDITWVYALLQNLARYVFKTGNWFEAHHRIPTNGPIRLDFDTDIVGLAFELDPQLPPIDTPHGRVEFLQAFGLTAREMESIKNETRSYEDVIAEHRATNPMLITDLSRRNG